MLTGRACCVLFTQVKQEAAFGSPRRRQDNKARTRRTDVQTSLHLAFVSFLETGNPKRTQLISRLGLPDCHIQAAWEAWRRRRQALQTRPLESLEHLAPCCSDGCEASVTTRRGHHYNYLEPLVGVLRSVEKNTCVERFTRFRFVDFL